MKKCDIDKYPKKTYTVKRFLEYIRTGKKPKSNKWGYRRYGILYGELEKKSKQLAMDLVKQVMMENKQYRCIPLDRVKKARINRMDIEVI